MIVSSINLIFFKVDEFLKEVKVTTKNAFAEEALKTLKKVIDKIHETEEAEVIISFYTRGHVLLS